MDLDGFKEINDTYGHEKGDLVLEETARRLISAVRGSDIVSRMGGDEFVLLLSRIMADEEIRQVCERILSEIRQPFQILEDLFVEMTASIGVSVYPGMVGTRRRFSPADQAMYKIKKRGKNCYTFANHSSEAYENPLKERITTGRRPARARPVPAMEGVGHMEKDNDGLGRRFGPFAAPGSSGAAPEEVCAFLGDEFCFVGTGEDEFAHSPQEMREYLARDIQEIPEPFTVELTLFQGAGDRPGCPQPVGGNAPQEHPVPLAAAGILHPGPAAGAWRLRTLWFSEPGSSQRGGEHYPRALVMEHIARQRQELLNDSLPGGMMGGYIEEGFPFYFVNNRMLEYLGYASEAGCLRTRGMVSNCMHPDDRGRSVDGEVAVKWRSAGSTWWNTG